MSCLNKIFQGKNGNFLSRIIIGIVSLLCLCLFFVSGPMPQLLQTGVAETVIIFIFSILLLVCVYLAFDFLFKTRDAVTLLAILIISAAAIILRLFLFDEVSSDYTNFLSHWLAEMRSLSGVEAIARPIGDYNMPYLYFLFILSKSELYDLYMIKLFSVVFDFVLALGVSAMVLELKNNKFAGIAAYCAALFLPTVFLNSAHWGQCDSIYAALIVWAMYFALKGHGKSASVFFALAFSFKIQTIFALPIIIFLVLRNKIRLKQLLLFPATFVLTLLPALLCGRSFYDTFSIYLKQTESYPKLTLNCPTLWALFPEDVFEPFGSASLYLAGAVVLLAILFIYKNRGKLGLTELFDVLFVFSLIFPFFLPRMHERYFYLAEILSVIYVLIHKGRFLPLLINLTSFSCYCAFLFGYRISSLSYLAIANFIIIIYVAYRFYIDLSNKTSCGEECGNVISKRE